MLTYCFTEPSSVFLEMSHGGSGDVGSNGNQLSRWFSPQLLAQARSGPSVPAQGMLSVEDIERLQQAVHN